MAEPASNAAPQSTARDWRGSRGRWRLSLVAAGVAGLGLVLYFIVHPQPREVILTGIVTTESVIISSEIPGRIDRLAAAPGDPIARGQVVATLTPGEWPADLAFYETSAQAAAALVTQAEADLGYQEAITATLIQQAESGLAAAQAQAAQTDADRENAATTLRRVTTLFRKSVESAEQFDQARTGFAAAKARSDAAHSQIGVARAAVAQARANAGLIEVRRAALDASQRQLAAARAQWDKARVRLRRTEIHAPIDGLVDVRAALPGEVVNPGQPILTLIDPENLWVRADVEEGIVDRLHLGDRLPVSLPSGVRREGTIFYRAANADYATQRDVSRTKRDIKTFELRIRCDNRDRSLAVGMTAHVRLPFGD